MGEESLIDHYNKNEYTYWALLMTIGFANEVHTPIILAYAAAYA